jgi:hypothetical protein
MNKLTGTAIALAAAGLFFGGCASYDKPSQTAQVKCDGINACKGQSECKSAKSACKGQNACKGQGYVSVSKQDCDQKGGKARATTTEQKAY